MEKSRCIFVLFYVICTCIGAVDISKNYEFFEEAIAEYQVSQPCFVLHSNFTIYENFLLKLHYLPNQTRLNDNLHLVLNQVLTKDEEVKKNKYYRILSC